MSVENHQIWAGLFQQNRVVKSTNQLYTSYVISTQTLGADRQFLVRQFPVSLAKQNKYKCEN